MNSGFKNQNEDHNNHKQDHNSDHDDHRGFKVITLKDIMADDYAAKVEQKYANNFLIVGSDTADDVLTGTKGNDFILGLGGADNLQGKEGSDALIGDYGYVLINGQGDTPTTIVIPDDILRGGMGDDLLVGDVEHLDHIPAGDVANTLAYFGNDKLYGDEGNDVLCGDGLIQNTVVAYDYVNIHAHWGNDELYGGKGDDILMGDNLQHYEIVNEAGGTGAILEFIHTHTMGHDDLYGDSGNDILVGDEGNYIFDVQGKVHLDYKETYANDCLEGGTGNDTLVGDILSFKFTYGADVNITQFTYIFGDDLIIGGQGDDILYGDHVTLDLQPSAITSIIDGKDTFVFDLRSSDGKDLIMDFQSNLDNLEFVVSSSSGDAVNDVDSLIKAIKDDGAGYVRVVFDNSSTIDFENIAFTGQDSIADLVANSFQIETSLTSVTCPAPFV